MLGKLSSSSQQQWAKDFVALMEGCVSPQTADELLATDPLDLFPIEKIEAIVATAQEEGEDLDVVFDIDISSSEDAAEEACHYQVNLMEYLIRHAVIVDEVALFFEEKAIFMAKCMEWVEVFDLQSLTLRQSLNDRMKWIADYFQFVIKKKVSFQLETLAKVMDFLQLDMAAPVFPEESEEVISNIPSLKEFISVLAQADYYGLSIDDSLSDSDCEGAAAPIEKEHSDDEHEESDHPGDFEEVKLDELEACGGASDISIYGPGAPLLFITYHENRAKGEGASPASLASENGSPQAD